MGDKRADGSKADAMQACKDLTEAPARADCMTKAESDDSGSGDGSMRGSGNSRSDMPDSTSPGQMPRQWRLPGIRRKLESERRCRPATGADESARRIGASP